MKITKTAALNLGKTAILAIVLLIASATKAQDIITLKNGTEIKTVVQKIGTSEVEYKQFDNQNGPVYTLKKSEIFMIKYANGNKDMFKENADEKTAPAPINSNKATGANNPAAIDTHNKLLFENRGMNYNILNSSGKRLSLNETKSLMTNVPEAFDFYTNGRTKRAWGYSFMALALTCEAAGIISIASASNNIDNGTGNTTANNDAALAQGYIFLGVGLFLCIPAEYIFLYAGRKDIKKATELYNNAIDKKKTPDLSLNFGITRSGRIGLMLNF